MGVDARALRARQSRHSVYIIYNVIYIYIYCILYCRTAQWVSTLVCCGHVKTVLPDGPGAAAFLAEFEAPPPRAAAQSGRRADWAGPG